MNTLIKNLFPAAIKGIITGGIIWGIHKFIFPEIFEIETSQILGINLPFSVSMILSSVASDVATDFLINEIISTSQKKSLNEMLGTLFDPLVTFGVTYAMTMITFPLLSMHDRMQYSLINAGASFASSIVLDMLEI